MLAGNGLYCDCLTVPPSDTNTVIHSYVTRFLMVVEQYSIRNNQSMSGSTIHSLVKKTLIVDSRLTGPVVDSVLKSLDYL